jgi:hypothetical protein
MVRLLERLGIDPSHLASLCWHPPVEGDNPLGSASTGLTSMLPSPAITPPLSKDVAPLAAGAPPASAVPLAYAVSPAIITLPPIVEPSEGGFYYRICNPLFDNGRERVMKRTLDDMMRMESDDMFDFEGGDINDGAGGGGG